MNELITSGVSTREACRTRTCLAQPGIAGSNKNVRRHCRRRRVPNRRRPHRRRSADLVQASHTR